MTATAAIAGPTCRRCQNTEQTCARNYPCCEHCTHFDEPETPLDLTPDRAPRPRPEQPMTTPTSINRDTIAELLARARPLTDAKVRRAVERLDQAHEHLRAALADYDSKAAARRDVERLERQLAEAKAKLRGGARPAAVPTNSGAPRQYEPVDCPDCGLTCGSKMGLSAHQRGGRCTGTA